MIPSLIIRVVQLCPLTSDNPSVMSPSLIFRVVQLCPLTSDNPSVMSPSLSLTPSLLLPVKCLGGKVHTYTPANSLFDTVIVL